MVLNSVITSRFHVCCKTPLACKKESKAVSGSEAREKYVKARTEVRRVRAKEQNRVNHTQGIR